MSNDLNPIENFKYLNSSSNLGGYWSLRICYTADIVQQLLQTDTELAPPAKFLYRENWISSWLPNQFSLEVQKSLSNSENGFDDTNQIKFTVDAKGQEDIFEDWFRKKLQGRRLCVEVTTGNGIVRLFSPMLASFNYVPATSWGDTAKYEIVFSRAKYITPANFLAVEEIQSTAANFEANPGANIKFILKAGADSNLYKYSHGVTDRIEESRECKQVLFLKNGDYYFFCSLKSESNVYQRFKLTINTA